MSSNFLGIIQFFVVVVFLILYFLFKIKFLFFKSHLAAPKSTHEIFIQKNETSAIKRSQSSIESNKPMGEKLQNSKSPATTKLLHSENSSLPKALECMICRNMPPGLQNIVYQCEVCSEICHESCFRVT